jgi:hypothetical protein
MENFLYQLTRFGSNGMALALYLLKLETLVDLLGFENNRS